MQLTARVVDRHTVGRQLRGYVALTKPRIIELLLVTTLPTMILAERGLPEGWLVAATLLGGTLAAAGANAFNMVADADIDRVMQRTQGRPLVTGVLRSRQALVFATVLEVAAFFELWFLVNLLSAVLAVSATLFYVFVYTLWLKRTSTQNIVIGGAAGAVPVLVGWAAVRGSIDWPPLVLFALIFFWTPPHFWALAVKYRDDYAAAGVPMLPAVASMRTTCVRILAYTFVVLGLSLVLAPVASLGAIYLAVAVGAGGVFVAQAVDLLRRPSTERAMRVFHWSITYVTLLFAGVAVDQLVGSW